MDWNPQKITARLSAGVTIIDVPREFDLSRAGEMRSARWEALRHGAPIVVDLTGCEFLDPTGMMVVISTYEQAREAGLPFALAGSGLLPKKVLNLVGMDRAVPYFPSLDEATNHVRVAWAVTRRNRVRRG